ncbi:MULTISPECIES: hypothetical protein [Acinetobacter]|uniref:hypothetical protein n=1 Tax=Acinetobacter TaxID=469 RepID=UPI00035D6FA7|nr:MULTISPECIES: hypothetical protein [Acinetobacter]MBI1447674.1 hypothetical protein [Acinetobacter sp. AC1-2]
MRIFLFFILTTTAFLSYGAETKVDKEFLNSGLIDKNYRYKNIADAATFFKQLANRESLSLPVMLNSDEEVVSMMATPFQVMYSYRIHRKLDNNSLKVVAQLYNNPKRISELCRQNYIHEFQRANSYVIKFIYSDLNGRLITETRLDKEVCNQ